MRPQWFFFLCVVWVALAAPVPTSQQFKPLIANDFPDPCFFKYGGLSYAFSTSTMDQRIHIQMASTADFSKWNYLGMDALPVLPAWVNSKNPLVWAPSVTRLDHTFILYFAAALATYPKLHCIGIARSESITGPYEADSSPLICPIDQGGAIDPSFFHDPSTDSRYLLYKIDGNTLGHGGSCNNGVPPQVPTPIMMQAIASDGATLLGDPVPLLDRETEDGPLVEAPSMIRARDGYYALFYSSGCYLSADYDIKWAVSRNIAGPYLRTGTLLRTSDFGLVSPGGPDINGDKLLFHANYGKGRAMYGAQISINVSSEIFIETAY